MRSKQTKVLYGFLIWIAACLLVLTAWTTYAWLAADHDVVYIDNLSGRAHAAYFNGGDGTVPADGATYKDANATYPSYLNESSAHPSVGPYQIDNAIQLYNLAWLQYLGYFNATDDSGAVPQTYFVLTADIDLTTGDLAGLTLPPIGTAEYPFLGNFDGRGFRIIGAHVSNLKSDLDNTGFGSDAVIAVPPDAQENGVLNDPAEIVGFFGVVGELAGSASGATYDSSVNEIKNVVIENATIKTQTSNSLAGVAAGYVNGTLENVKLVGGSIQSSATAAVSGVGTSNLSDYGAVGYCTPDYCASRDEVTVTVYEPQVLSATGSGSQSGIGNAWGGSVDMRSMYQDLLARYQAAEPAMREYANSYTVVHNADGTVEDPVPGEGTSTVTLLTPNNLTILEKAYDDDTAVASYTFVRRNDNDTQWLYLYGEHDVDVDADVTHEFTENLHYIYSGSNYLCFDGTDFSNTTDENAATKWVITDDGLIYRVSQSGNNYYRHYLIRTAENALSFIGPYSVTQNAPDAATRWEITDTAIHSDSYFLCYKDSTWKLDLLVQTNVLCDSAQEHYMAVNNGVISVVTAKASAITWTETPVNENGGFTLSANDGGTTRYLMLNDAEGTLVMETAPQTPTVWYKAAATETETPKVYTLVEGTEGYAIAYDPEQNIWTISDYSTAPTGSGQGESFGDSIPMKTIHDRLLAAWNEADTGHNVSYVSAETIYIRNGVEEAPKTTARTQRDAPYITTQQFFTDGGSGYPYASYTFVRYNSSDPDSTNFLYLYGEDTITNNAVTKTVTTVVIDTVDGFYILDGDGNYMAATASGVTAAASAAQATKWRIDGGRIYAQFTEDDITVHYLRNNNGQLQVSTTSDANWTVDAENSTIANGAYSLCCLNGSWTLIQETEYLTFTGGGETFSMSIGGVDCDQWILTQEGYLYTFNGTDTTKYYLSAADGTLGTTTNANSAAVWTVNEDSVTTNGLYLVYGDGAWTLTPAASVWTIASDGFYIRLNNGAIDEGGELAAAKWIMDRESATTRISARVGNQTYYLYNNNGALGATTNAGSAANWTVTDDTITTGGLSLYRHGDRWWVADPSQYRIIKHDDTHYLGLNGTTLTNVAAEESATGWIFSAETGDNITISTYVNGTRYYLLHYNNTLALSTTNSNNTWTVDADGTIHYSVTSGSWFNQTTTTYYLACNNNTWTLTTSRTQNVDNTYLISNNGHYLSYVGGEITATDEANATQWVFANLDGDGTIHVRGDTNVYLVMVQSGNSAVPSTSNSNAGNWRTSTNWQGTTATFQYRTRINNTRYYLRYNNGWTAGTSSMSLNISQVVESNGMTELEILPMSVDTTLDIDEETFDTEVTHVSEALDRSALTEAAKIDWTTSRTSQTVASSYHLNPTYLPLSFDSESGTIPRNNTGYIISGNREGSTGPGLEAYGQTDAGRKGDIRVSGYYTRSNITNSLTNNQLDDGKVYTISAAGRQTITQYGASNFKKYEDDGDIKGSKSKMNESLRTSNSIYGLHFMNAAISMDYTVTVRNAYINGKIYESYVMPQDCIDFRLKERGYINFFAGTYFSGNNSFFSLHRIEHNTDGTLQSIKEILEIYQKGDKDPYVYKLQEGSTVTYESWSYYPNGNLKEHKTYTGVPDGYTLAFNTSWIKRQNSVETNAVYYFEIPADPGEYALGSVDGGTGAYLMYLDIGSAGAKDKLVGDSMLLFEETPGLQVSHSDAGTASYTVTGGQLGEQVRSNATYYPLTWDGDAVSVENTGYVVSGAHYSEGVPEGDIRVAYYDKDSNAGTAYSIRNSLNNAGTLNNARVYTILPNGTETSITQYGLDNQFTLQYRGVSAEMNALLEGEDNVYGLHFMPAEISKENYIVADQVTLVTLPGDHTASNYQLPEDCIDFHVEDQGRITFFAGTFFSGSRVTSFFSLHRVFRDENGAISDIREITEIWSKNGATSGGASYLYKFADGGDNLYDSDGVLAQDTTDYSMMYDVTLLSAENNGLRQDTVYYFEIPVDPGEYALGCAEGNGAYLLYLDIAANAMHIQSQTIIDAKQERIVSLRYPLGVAFVESASDAVDPATGVYLPLTMANSSGTTSFSMSGNNLAVTNASSSLSGYNTYMSIGDGKTLTVNGGTTWYTTGSVRKTETIRTVDMNPNGEVKTTEYLTQRSYYDAYPYYGDANPTVTKTVTRKMGETQLGEPETATLTYTDYEARQWCPPYDYPSYDGQAFTANAATILRFGYNTGYKAAPSLTVERSGNSVFAEQAMDDQDQVKEVDLTFYDTPEDSYEIWDAVRDTGSNTPATMYVITGTSRLITVTVASTTNYEFYYRTAAGANENQIAATGVYN